jgi:hypothetical protein
MTFLSVSNLEARFVMFVEQECLFCPVKIATHSRRRLWVKNGHAEQVAAAAGSPQKAALLAVGRDFCHGPCVDGSGLARVLFTRAAVVGAAMCSAC